MRGAIEASNPLLILINARGDYLLNLPAVRAVAFLFRNKLTVATRNGISGLLYRDVPARRFLEVDLDFSTANLDQRFDADDLARRVGTCDLLLSLNPWHAAPTRRLLEVLHPKWSIGYHPDFGEAIALDFSKHNIDLGFDLVTKLEPSLNVGDFAAPPAVDPEAAALVDKWLSKLPNGHKLIALHGETKDEKCWRASDFVCVLDHILTRLPDAWVVDVAHGRAPHDNGVHAGRVLVVPGLPMSYALALVARADFFIGVDSCFLHAADLFRIPGVALFGPTDPHEFGFRFSKCRHVKASTMQQIDTGSVIQAVDELLDEIGLR